MALDDLILEGTDSRRRSKATRRARRGRPPKSVGGGPHAELAKLDKAEAEAKAFLKLIKKTRKRITGSG